tara:strand:- start:1898 stop:2908 length:1011 start_codon:yes stop_codon:yes gene_type:complete
MGLIKNALRKTDLITKILHSYKTPIFPYYHTVSNNNLNHIEGLFSYKNEKEFIKDLDFLLSTYNVLNPNDLVECILTGESIPENSFVLSFDDGLSEVYYNIVPILNKKGINAIFFINNRYIDNTKLFYKHKVSLIVQELADATNTEISKKIKDVLKENDLDLGNPIKSVKSLYFKDHIILDELLSLIGIEEKEFLKTQKPYLTIEQLKGIKLQGHVIGGHTVNHYPMDKLSLDEQVIEIIDSVNWVKEYLGEKNELFSFPFSDSNASMKLFERLFVEIPELICMGNSGMTKDFSVKMIQRFSLEKEKRGDVEVRMNIAYGKYLSLIGKGTIKRKKE